MKQIIIQSSEGEQKVLSTEALEVQAGGEKDSFGGKKWRIHPKQRGIDRHGNARYPAMVSTDRGEAFYRDRPQFTDDDEIAERLRKNGALEVKLNPSIAARQQEKLAREVQQNRQAVDELSRQREVLINALREQGLSAEKISEIVGFKVEFVEDESEDSEETPAKPAAKASSKPSSTKAALKNTAAKTDEKEDGKGTQDKK